MIERIKAWHIFRESIEALIKSRYPDMTDLEVSRIIREIEEECKDLSIEELAACIYRKLGEIKSVKAKRV